ncbi:MAG: HWE histidine kinase domain-containing protein [Pseudorhodoplanes sp.]
MGTRMRMHDWATSPLGPPQGWSEGLKNALGIMLHSGLPMAVAWGPQFILFYNDACIPLIGPRKHPAAFGRPVSEHFGEIWSFLEPNFRNVIVNRSAMTFTDQMLTLDRQGYPEDGFFTFSCSPIVNPEGQADGIFVAWLETTGRVLRERRLSALRDVLDMQSAPEVDKICGAATEILARYAADVPFSLIYQDVGEGRVKLCGQSGFKAGDPLAPPEIALDDSAAPWPIATAMASGSTQIVDLGKAGAKRRAAIIPIIPGGYEKPAAVLIAGISARSVYDPEYENFFRSLGFNIASVIATAQAFEIQRKRADTALALAESEARLAFALRAGRLGYWEMDPSTRALFASDIYKTNWGRAPSDDFTYADVKASIHPDDLALHEDAVQKAIDTQGALDIDYRVIWPDRSVHWLRVRGHAVYNLQGEPLHMAGISLDITDRKEVEESLREETTTLERMNELGKVLAAKLDLRQIVQTVTDAATQLSGAQFGAFFYNVENEKGESYTLYTISGVPPEAFSQFPMPRNTAVFAPTFSGSGIVRSDDIRSDPRYGKSAPHHGMPKGHLPVVSYLAVPVIARSGKVLGGLFFGHEKRGVFTERAERVVAGIAAQAAIAIDNATLFAAAEAEITERRRVEKHQDLLLAELNHRVRNTLAIVQSIAGQTLRHADSAAAFRTGFEARIMALSEAHRLLTDSNWEGASLSDIVQRVLSPYAAEGRPRYTLSSDENVRVGPNTAVSLVMAFHELATNAAKYGALSNAKGIVQIRSWVTDSTTSQRLHLNWEEKDGPPVKPPTRRGFGARLIRSLSEDTGGKVRLEFEPSGLICEFDIPLVLASAS